MQFFLKSGIIFAPEMTRTSDLQFWENETVPPPVLHPPPNPPAMQFDDTQFRESPSSR